MTLWDVIHLEGYDSIIQTMIAYTKDKDIDYLPVTSLKDLKDTLKTEQAKVYLLCNSVRSDNKINLAVTAEPSIEHIRELQPDARIFLYTANPAGKELAEKWRVDHFEKLTHSYDDIFARLKEYF